MTGTCTLAGCTPVRSAVNFLARTWSMLHIPNTRFGSNLPACRHYTNETTMAGEFLIQMDFFQQLTVEHHTFVYGTGVNDDVGSRIHLCDNFSEVVDDLGVHLEQIQSFHT